MMPSKNPYIAFNTGFVTGFSLRFESGRNFPARTGTRKIATSREETRAITIVKIAALNICPINPRSLIKKMNGRNTQIVVRLPEITDISIS